MKNKYFLLCIMLLPWVLSAQIVNIPDANFKFALVNYEVVDTDNDGVPDSDVDTNNDGEIQVSEALATESLYPRGSAIFSMDGIEAFTNLKILNCSQNAISELDLSQNPDLEALACFFNNLSELDLTTSPKLKRVECDFNDLTTLDLSQNVELERIRFAYNNLTTIDLSQNLLLERLDGDSNNLIEIDVSLNTSLTSVSLDKNELTSLDLSQNTLLDFLDVNNNPLEELDLSQNTMLTKFWCFNSGLTSLNVQNGNNTDFAIFNVGGNPNLTCIQVDDVVFANNQTNWVKDEIANYSENCLLGVEDISVSNMQIYPNPTSGVINISNLENVNFEQMDVYDMRGRLLIRKQQVSPRIDLSNLPKGVFFIQFSSENGTFTKKVVKG